MASCLSRLSKWEAGLFPEDVEGSAGYNRRILNQFIWAKELLYRLLQGENVLEDDVPNWFWMFRAERFNRVTINEKLVKLYQRINLRASLIFCMQQAVNFVRVSKNSYPIRLKTLFGDITVDSPRFISQRSIR